MDYKRLKKDFDKAKSKRSNFDRMYQVIGEYVAMNRQDFEGKPSNGEFLVDRIFNSDGVFAAANSASTIIGMLWPGSAANTFELAPMDSDDEKNEDWFRKINREVHEALDDPRANLSEALEEYMFDQIMFGTSGVGGEYGDKSKLFFSPYGVKEIYPITGKGGRVIGFYLFFQWDVQRVVSEYGISKVHEKIRKLYEKGDVDAEISILFACRPRKEKKAEKGKLSMPFEGVHLDYQNCHPMKEDGYYELPVAIGRFRKLVYEDMGRSLAMNALPDIREANALSEAIIIATEKILEMPKGVMSDGEFGGGVIDQSAGAINVFNASGNIGGAQPVFDIGSPPNIPWAEARLEKLKESIAQHFLIDRLLDFNNDTQMTLGEAQIRNQMRTASMAGMLGRQIQVITQVIERAVGLLMRKGYLGVKRGSIEEAEIIAKGEQPIYLPDNIVKKLDAGKDAFKINYKTKAALAFSSEQYMAILELMNIATSQAQVNPAGMKRLDFDGGFKRLAEIRGINFLIRSNDDVAAQNKAEQEQQQSAMMLQGGEQAAGIAEKMANIEQVANQ